MSLSFISIVEKESITIRESIHRLVGALSIVVGQFPFHHERSYIYVYDSKYLNHFESILDMIGMQDSSLEIV
jgi:hypothetical protein